MTDHPTIAETAQASRKTLQVLLIEDDARWRAWVEAHMESTGYQVASAADGRAGLELAAKIKPEIILCDIEMPVLNGYGVLEALRRQPETSDIPFIFLTSRNARADQRKGMVLGADDYLTKPFSREELLAAIGGVLRKREALTQRLRHYTEEYRRELAAPWAHELLTPLNGILGIASMLEAEPGAVSPAELRELARSIHESARRQQALARKLVQYFQLEQLREYNWTDAAAVVEAAASIEDEAIGVAERAGRNADLKVECARAAVKISPQWLRAIAAELTENACRFSAKGTPLKVTGRIVDGLYRIEVIDQGGGMTAAERSAAAAFRQFERGPREQQGLGLGLAIVRNVTRLHRGSCSLEPGPNGVGLRAVVELPLAD
ncbi:MAG TPA: response regulator [Lacunisphaera sp.]|nr:response regulator [Lacunisphaera sp.]